MKNRRFMLESAAALAGLALTRRGQAATAAAASPLSADERALHALNRLGYGPRPADAAAIAEQGAERWLARFLDEQLQPRRLPQPDALATRLACLEVLKLDQAELMTRYRDAVRAAREARREQAKGETPSADALNAVREKVRPLVLQAGTARLARALQSPAQLEEVLTEFWFNHFNVFSGKNAVGVLVADYEQTAIRPHVLGRFRDMLGATAKHPAMLVYLDNAQSAAPRMQPRASGEGARQRGLNENYARELMELHTLGVDGGYTQRDVTELARMLTGWGIDARAGKGPVFEFDARRHDRGSKTWLGKAIPAAGQAEGERALDVLAAHPSTARHLAFKFAQAFVADQPPPALVDRLADSFKSSGGDLRELTRTLMQSDEFWSREAYQAKFKTPYQYLISSLRALDLPLAQPQPLLQALQQAGQPLYGAQTPDGYKNTAAAWRNPEALTQRVQLATTLGQRSGVSPQRLSSTLGAALSEPTRRTLAAEPAGQQVALLLASPDFMKR
ncbi:DUF1800 domain-containing protein [Roseateles asaccharophilus]|uniref:Uncharacterized protein (DUF1800 family) n=1 Tax=Roseateles asaccharophilus TaxID=582607 RepID=A0ABU2A6Q5_9BURK|nr:DUF1800 domain-containing protein [Roseateles asaccharophilus]MDR7332836.1 uncharacterized protein (DUF1800 family) [Roseateles asaccharophilus]